MRRTRVEARRCGITDALHMEVDVAPADIEAETANVDGSRARARQPACAARSAPAGRRTTDFPAFLERQRANPFVKGFRRVLHVVPDDSQRERGLSATTSSGSAGTGLTFDICVLPRPDRQGDRARRPCAGRPVRARPLRRARHQGRRRASVAREHAPRSPGGRTSSARSPASSPMPTRTPGRSTTCALCRACDRALRLGPRRLGQRLAGLHAGRPRFPPGSRRRTRITLGCSADERARLFSVNARRIWRLPETNPRIR